MSWRWTVVVPVKDAVAGKSRLAGALPDRTRAELVRAMALDTITAALAAEPVERVLVVGGDPALARELEARARVVVLGDPDGWVTAAGRSLAGLDAAVAAGASSAHRSWADDAVAVLLADLPMLRPAELTGALAAAQGHPRALVADAAGTGTTMLTAAAGIEVDPWFGPGSAHAHARAGHVLLDVPATSGLRRDVDLPGDLAQLRTGGPGPWTRKVLG